MRKKLKQRAYIKKKADKARELEQDCKFDQVLLKKIQPIAKSVLKYEECSFKF